jgi:hypothetical protein
MFRRQARDEQACDRWFARERLRALHEYAEMDRQQRDWARITAHIAELAKEKNVNDANVVAVPA